MRPTGSGARKKATAVPLRSVQLDVSAVSFRFFSAACDPMLLFFSWTSLHYAAIRGHAEMAQMLLQHGAHANARDNAGCDLRTPSQAPGCFTPQIHRPYSCLLFVSFSEVRKAGFSQLAPGTRKAYLWHALCRCTHMCVACCILCAHAPRRIVRAACSVARTPAGMLRGFCHVYVCCVLPCCAFHAARHAVRCTPRATPHVSRRAGRRRCTTRPSTAMSAWPFSSWRSEPT